MQKDVFNIDDVQFAVAETNGSLSVLLKPEKRTLTVEDAEKNGCDDAMACVVVADGQIIRSDFGYSSVPFVPLSSRADCMSALAKLRQASTTERVRIIEFSYFQRH